MTDESDVRQLRDVKTGKDIYPRTIGSAIIDEETGQPIGDLGIPIYTQERINQGNLPSRYIGINNPSNISTSYTDELLSIIRKLQIEVTRLKRSFQLGISSYTGTNTAMSAVIDDEITEEEPLWAIEEDGLDPIIDVLSEYNLHKAAGAEVVSDSGTATIEGSAYWLDDNTTLSVAGNMHSKQFLFLQTYGIDNKNVQFTLRTAKTSEDENPTRIAMSDFTKTFNTMQDAGVMSLENVLYDGMFFTEHEGSGQAELSVLSNCPQFLNTNVAYSITFKFGGVSINSPSYISVVDRYDNTVLLIKAGKDYIDLYNSLGQKLTQLPVNINTNTIDETYDCTIIVDPDDGATLSVIQGTDVKLENVYLGEFFNIGCLQMDLNDLDSRLYLNNIAFRYTNDTSGYRVIDLDLKTLCNNILKVPDRAKFNIQMIVSRQVTVGGIATGVNFIWMSISDAVSTKVLKEGYWNGITLTPTREANTMLDDKYALYRIDFTNLSTDKCKIYSKYEDFSRQVVASRPTDEDYRYRAAHLTIRSVKDEDELQAIVNYSPENELVWEKASKVLYIKSDNKFIKIGSTSSAPSTDEEIMTALEIVQKLQELGLVYIGDNEDSWQLNAIEGFTMINNETGRQYTFEVDPYGNLKCKQEINDKNLLDRLKDAGLYSSNGTPVETATRNPANLVRGFIGRLGYLEGKNAGANISTDKDIGLYADRLKIGAFYAPCKTTKAYGCTHGYIELENTGKSPINLKGINLYYTYYDESYNNPVNTSVHNRTIYLPLTGSIPAGGTYLIRCKQYAEPSEANVFINVDTYDQEWYVNGELLDLSYTKDKSHGFMLFFGTKWRLLTIANSAWQFGEEQEITELSTPVILNAEGFSVGDQSYDKDAYPYVYDENFIDAIYFGDLLKNASGYGYWTMSTKCVYKALSADRTFYPNAIMKNTFELDPAKQAYQALNIKDSSRARNANDADFQIVPLDNEYISFPKTSETYPVNKFTPKASFQGKMVGTDKNDIDKEKPNMVTCSFGIDAHRTKTFNWISAGYFDEFVWIRKKGNTDWMRFESYTAGQYPYQFTPAPISSTHTIEQVNEGLAKNETFSVQDIDITVDIELSPRLDNRRVEFTKQRKITTTTTTWTFTYTNNNFDYTACVDANKKVATSTVTDYIDENKIIDVCYARMTGVFPGTTTQYTAHKCIVDLETPTETPVEYEYVVGRSLRSGQPDEKHTSAIHTFKLYPREGYRPMIYQTSDQQGFHWMEYQVWAAAADFINKQINDDLKAIDHIYTGAQLTECLGSGNTMKFPNDKQLTKNGNSISMQFNNTSEYLAIKLSNNNTITLDNTNTTGTIPSGATITSIKYHEVNPKIIPVVLNTGDMTQSGARINEWLDYYNAGHNLFDHLEQVNVVGNNDLCGTDPSELGTGDDSGKSNGYYFHVFYCYETDIHIPTIIKDKYVPSTYYIDINNTRLLQVNSEITSVNCEKWYGLKAPNNEVINAYTGWSMKTSTITDAEVYDSSFTSIYTMLYKMTQIPCEYKASSVTRASLQTEQYRELTTGQYETDGSSYKVAGEYSDKCYVIINNSVYERVRPYLRLIASMHEMPFTVITDDNLNKERGATHRSLSGATTFSLCGAHVNQMTTTDSKAIYWFSRLMEFRGCELVLGGHKHTYSCTYPLREYYFYGDRNSLTNGPMYMEATLQNDIASFAASNISTRGKQVSLTKRPLTNHSSVRSIDDTGDYIIPVLYTQNFATGNSFPNNKGVVYFMCQSTGFKLFSNKELPSPKQMFSRFLPKSNVTGGKADTAQRSPMYSLVDCPLTMDSAHRVEVSLIKLKNIQPTESAVLSPIYFGKTAIEKFYLNDTGKSISLTTDSAYGSWEKTQQILLTV